MWLKLILMEIIIWSKILNNQTISKNLQLLLIQIKWLNNNKKKKKYNVRIVGSSSLSVLLKVMNFNVNNYLNASFVLVFSLKNIWSSIFKYVKKTTRRKKHLIKVKAFIRPMISINNINMRIMLKIGIGYFNRIFFDMVSIIGTIGIITIRDNGVGIQIERI